MIRGTWVETTWTYSQTLNGYDERVATMGRGSKIV